MTKEQIRFVGRYLFYLNALGLVEPEEERHQWVFHIMVSDRYSAWRQTQTIFPLLPAESPATAPLLGPVAATPVTRSAATLGASN